MCMFNHFIHCFFLKIGYILKWQATRVAHSYKVNLRRSIMSAVYKSCNNNEQGGGVLGIMKQAFDSHKRSILLSD